MGGSVIDEVAGLKAASTKQTTIHDFSTSKHFISNTIAMTLIQLCLLHTYTLLFDLLHHNIKVNLCRASYIHVHVSGRMLNTFSYGSGLSQLTKRDNLHIKDKRPAPNLSIIQEFYCITHFVMDWFDSFLCKFSKVITA